MSITLISFLWNVYCHVLHCTWLTYPSILRKWINCLINLRKSSWLDPNLDNYLGAPEIQFRLAISKRQLIHLLSNANNKCSQSFKFILVSKSSTQIHWYTYCHLGAYCSQNTFFTLNHECHILKIWCAKSFLFKVFFLKVAAIEKKLRQLQYHQPEDILRVFRWRVYRTMACLCSIAGVLNSSTIIILWQRQRAPSEL